MHLPESGEVDPELAAGRLLDDLPVVPGRPDTDPVGAADHQDLLAGPGVEGRGPEGSGIDRGDRTPGVGQRDRLVGTMGPQSRTGRGGLISHPGAPAPHRLDCLDDAVPVITAEPAYLFGDDPALQLALGRLGRVLEVTATAPVGVEDRAGRRTPVSGCHHNLDRIAPPEPVV